MHHLHGASRRDVPPARPFRVALAVALVAPTLWLAACASAQRAPPPVIVQPLVLAPGQKAVTVSEAQSGASVALEAGQELVVRLPVSPTSGLEWSLVDLPPGVLAVRGSMFERALRNSDIDEAGGASVWRLHAAAAGEAALKFELRRPRSLAPALRVVSFAVTVR